MMMSSLVGILLCWLIEATVCWYTYYSDSEPSSLCYYSLMQYA